MMKGVFARWSPEVYQRYSQYEEFDFLGGGATMLALPQNKTSFFFNQYSDFALEQIRLLFFSNSAALRPCIFPFQRGIFCFHLAQNYGSLRGKPVLIGQKDCDNSFV